jgi:peptide/nickel transport system permease protein
MAALVILVLLIATSLFGGRFYAWEYGERSPERSVAPSLDHWFGTDELGRDTFASVLHGAQKSVQIGLLVAVVSTFIGVLVGSLAGYYRGWVDALLMRVTDLFLTVPVLVVLLVVSNRYRGQSDNWLSLALIITFFFWMYQARLVRGEFLSLREREFVEASRAVGASNFRIILRHLLPNAVGSIIVNSTLTVAAAILTESALSFLGFGVAPPDTSLGQLVADGAQAARTRWWLFYMPGMWLILLLLCVNFVGDGLRDAFDPRQKRVRA